MIAQINSVSQMRRAASVTTAELEESESESEDPLAELRARSSSIYM